MPHLLVALTQNLPWHVSQEFAAYFVLQATIAWIIARRKGNWAAVAGFTGIGAIMATIAVFRLPL